MSAQGAPGRSGTSKDGDPLTQALARTSAMPRRSSSPNTTGRLVTWSYASTRKLRPHLARHCRRLQAAPPDTVRTQARTAAKQQGQDTVGRRSLSQSATNSLRSFAWTLPRDKNAARRAPPELPSNSKRHPPSAPTSACKTGSSSCALATLPLK